MARTSLSRRLLWTRRTLTSLWRSSTLALLARLFPSLHSSLSYTIKPLTTNDDRHLYEAIYGSLSGATENDAGTELFPCDSEVNVTFIFGGQEFPVHPLDIFFENKEGGNACEPQVCGRCSLSLIHADVPSSSISRAATVSKTCCSVRLGFMDSRNERLPPPGDAFLRNVYALHHFGDTIRGGPTQPYIQLLSTLDVAQAHDQFIEAHGDSPDLLLPSDDRAARA
jgi:hypothetical protein